MRKNTGLTLFILLTLGLFFGSPVSAGNAEFPSGDEGARQLIRQFLDPAADKGALTMSLHPDPEDYKAYFVGEAADKAMKIYESDWKRNPVISPKPGQTEFLLSKATTDELAADAPAANNLPGGYRHVVDKLSLGHTIYRFKFVKPGERLGMAYGGLIYINGHWVIFPKPWRVFR